jgi:hypothetical protein
MVLLASLAWAGPYADLAGGVTAGVLPGATATLQLGAGARARRGSLGAELRLLPQRYVSFYHSRGQVDLAVLACGRLGERVMLDVCARAAVGTMWARTQGTQFEPRVEVGPRAAAEVRLAPGLGVRAWLDLAAGSRTRLGPGLAGEPPWTAPLVVVAPALALRGWLPAVTPRAD